MKTNKLIKRLKGLMQGAPKETPRKKLRKTVKALREKQRDLEKKLQRIEGKHARRRLKRKIDVLRAQRRKGTTLYKSLQSG